MAQATSGDVLLAILALDAYNRGPTPGYALDESQIGNATFASDINDTLYAKSAASADFYAAQYTLSGSNNPLPGTSTVIAYRGTDFNGTLGPNLTDVATGWTLSAGYDQASQAQLAKEYYTYVTQSAIYSTAPSNVFLTGHSLGGGLAGFVSALTGANADIFNNIAFGSGAVGDSLSHDVQQGVSDITAFLTGGSSRNYGDRIRIPIRANLDLRRFKRDFEEHFR